MNLVVGEVENSKIKRTTKNINEKKPKQQNESKKKNVTTNEENTSGRHRARVSMPRLHLVRGLRAVEACEWFPRAVPVHCVLRKQHRCQ